MNIKRVIGLFQLIYNQKFPLEFLSIHHLQKDPFDLQKKIFFKLFKKKIYLSDNYEDFKSLSKLKLDNQIIEFYKNTGLIIPPHTIYKDIFCVPVGFKFCKSKNDFILENKLIYKDEDTINLLGSILNKNYPYKKINLLLSGGADSSLLLLLLRKFNKEVSIKSVFFNSGNLKKDFFRAQKLCNLLNSEFEEIKPKFEDPSDVKDFIIKNTKKFNEPIFDPLLFTVNTIFRKFKNKTIVFDGQGADTVLGGLPHHLLVLMHKNILIRSLRILGLLEIFKNLIKPFRNRSRYFYRLFKLLISLREKNISECLVNALFSSNQEINKNKIYYDHIQILNMYLQYYDEISFVSLFFLSILSSRELQKYKINDQLTYCLPYLDKNFIHHCLSIPAINKCRFNKRKRIIIDYLNSNLPYHFSSSQQLPFEAHSSHILFDKNKKNFDPLIKSKRIRDISIKTLKKKLFYQ